MPMPAPVDGIATDDDKSAGDPKPEKAKTKAAAKATAKPAGKPGATAPKPASKPAPAPKQNTTQA